MHCIVSGGGLTGDKKIRKSSGKFFIPVAILRDKFKGKYMAFLFFTKTAPLPFLLPLKSCVILITVNNGKIISIKRTGAHT